MSDGALQRARSEGAQRDVPSKRLAAFTSMPRTLNRPGLLLESELTSCAVFCFFASGEPVSVIVPRVRCVLCRAWRGGVEASGRPAGSGGRFGVAGGVGLAPSLRLPGAPARRRTARRGRAAGPGTPLGHRAARCRYGPLLDRKLPGGIIGMPVSTSVTLAWHQRRPGSEGVLVGARIGC